MKTTPSRNSRREDRSSGHDNTDRPKAIVPIAHDHGTRIIGAAIMMLGITGAVLSKEAAFPFGLV